MNNHTDGVTVFNDKVADAMREQVAERPNEKLQALIDAYDAGKAEGKTMGWKFDPTGEKISLVEIEQVEVELPDLDNLPEDMIGPDGKPLIDFAYMDDEALADDEQQS